MKVVLLALSGVGIVLTGYLSWTALYGHSVRVCSVGSSCDVVLTSQWASLFGVPTAVWGLLTYVTLAGTAGAPVLVSQGRAAAPIQGLPVSYRSGSLRSAMHVCVCVCTYKRPKFLRRLLEALSEQETEELFSYSIVVVDNDSQKSANQVVAEFAEQSRELWWRRSASRNCEAPPEPRGKHRSSAYPVNARRRFRPRSRSGCRYGV